MAILKTQNIVFLINAHQQCHTNFITLQNIYY